MIITFLHRYFKWVAAAALLLAASGVIVELFRNLSRSTELAQDIIENHLHEAERDIRNVTAVAPFRDALTDYNKLDAYVSKHFKPSYKVYVYKNDSLMYWSSNEIIPVNISYLKEQTPRFYKQGHGYYEVFMKTYPYSEFDVVVLIPIYKSYFLSNKYLENGFTFRQSELKRFRITNADSPGAVQIKDYAGQYLFSIRQDDSISISPNPLILMMELTGFILLFWAAYHIIRRLIRAEKYKPAIAGMILFMVLMDLVICEFRVVAFTQETLLFSSNLYASSFFGDSLGVVLVRALLLLWLASFLKYIPAGDTAKISGRKWVVIFPAVFFFLILYVIHSVIRNSVISFNFYAFNTLDRYTIISMVIFGICFTILILILKWIFSVRQPGGIILYAGIAGFLGCVAGYITGDHKDIWYPLFIVFWLVTFFMFFYFDAKPEYRNVKYRFLSNLIMISMLAFLVSVSIIYNTDEKNYEIQKHKLQELVSERDIGEEYVLIENEKAIRQDNFIKNYFANPYLMNVDLDERLTNKYFKPLMKEYTINIYAFDKDHNPLRGIMSKDFKKVNRSRFFKKTQPITENFYYLPLKENGEKYLGYFPIVRDSVELGSLFIEFVPKIFTSYSAYPELLLKNKNEYDEEFEQFSYAIYDNKYLIKQKGDFEYKLNLDHDPLTNSEYRIVKQSGYEHLIYFGKEKQAIITEPERTLLNTLSVFSYAVLFFIVFFILIDYVGLVDKLWGDESIRQLFSGRTLQKQIQNSMIALVLFSLAVIGLVTLFYFQYQYGIYQNGRLLKQVNSVIKNFNQFYVDAYPTHVEGSFEWVSKQKIKTLSTIYSLDINVYNEKGELMETSQPEIFKRNLVATKMDPKAYTELCIHNKSKYVHDETIGKLKFLSAYQSFRANGKVYGYLNFPYYGKEKSFREDISYFLVALVNVYVLLLLAAALLAVFLSRTITNSLTLIAENIKGVELGKINTPIAWVNDDEIGLLVKQYNSMLAELERSAELLGRSEREGAWREMAKQVAHEIKNPLTPMKLSVQHLQRAMKENAPDVKELTEKVTERLIVQIDNLSNIATAFSDFARMPQGDYQKIDIVPAIRETVELFNEMENVEFYFSLPLEPCYVMGDANQWMRVCTNIIKNATQAIPEFRKGRIDLSLKVEEDTYVMAVKDNGVGIDDNKHHKIFEPNFTTKTSGTGLGLAIAKNIIEKMGGKIWFESKLNEYTVFYIELPKFVSGNENRQF